MTPDDPLVVVDAVRIREQIVAIRRAFGSAVVHVHLLAPREELERRYAKRPSTAIRELTSYAAVLQNRTERGVRRLERIADVLIDTKSCQPEDVLARTAAYLGLYGRDAQLVDVIVGGQFGSEGKGHVASYLAREYDVLVRVGGPNAGHTVFREPETYTFHHLPSGTFRNEQATLVIGPGAVIYPPILLREIAHHKVAAGRLFIDPRVMIIEEADRMRERPLVREIGSTGQGVGAATARRIMGRYRGIKLAHDLRDLKPFLRETLEVLEVAYARGQRILLEGTQGTGLSLYHGPYPYVTSRDTTVSGSLAEAGIPPRRVRKVIMVCRSYPIRVESPRGRSSGPLSIPLNWTIIAKRSRLDAHTLRQAERTSTTHRRRRVGEFDWDLLRKAATLNSPTDVALTFVDYLSASNRDARRFEQLTPESIRFIQEVERVSSAPVSLISTRFDYRSIIDRRQW